MKSPFFRIPSIPNAAWGVLLCTACGAHPGGGSSESTGMVAMMLKGKENATCVSEAVRNVKTGRTFTRDTPLEVGRDTTIELHETPAGDIEITAHTTAEYDGSHCTGPRTYVADPIRAVVAPGESATFRQTFRAVSDQVVIDGEYEDPYVDAGGCVDSNLALNQAGAGAPHALESDEGWGGGYTPRGWWQMVDGERAYSSWSNGLAFTGGHADANGGGPYLEPAGVRQITISFEETKTFHQVVLWWHGAEHTPDSGILEVFTEDEWVPIEGVTRTYGTVHADGPDSGYSDSDIYEFSAVSGSKVRYSFDNSGHNINGSWNVHGWLYEIEVMGCD